MVENGQFLYNAMNLIFDMAIILSILKAPTNWCRIIKGPLTWEGMGKINWKSLRLSL